VIRTHQSQFSRTVLQQTQRA